MREPTSIFMLHVFRCAPKVTYFVVQEVGYEQFVCHLRQHVHDSLVHLLSLVSRVGDWKP
jgi:hypothetical protein